MFKRTFEYEDFLGNKRVEEHHFHLSEAEVMKWLTTDGDYTLDKLLVRLAEENNGEKIIDVFEDLILTSYGKVSLDGRRFEKSEELSKEFKETPAYSMLFTDMMKDAKYAANFVKAIIPRDMDKKLEEILKNGMSDTEKVVELLDVKDKLNAEETPGQITK